MREYSDRAEWMTDDQWRCAELIAEVFGGFHHLNAFKDCANGVRVILHQNDLSTWDWSHLTHLVVLAHLRSIRVSIGTAGMRLEVRAHPRDPAATSMMLRHPGLREAIARFAPEEATP